MVNGKDEFGRLDPLGLVIALSVLLAGSTSIASADPAAPRGYSGHLAHQVQRQQLKE